MITEFKLPYHGSYVREIKYSKPIMCLPEGSNDLIVALLRRCYPEITEESINELAYKNKAFTIFGTIQNFNGGMCYAVLYRHEETKPCLPKLPSISPSGRGKNPKPSSARRSGQAAFPAPSSPRFV